MSNNLNEDFVDFLTSLNDNDVEYILVGGYAVIFHGYNRTTGDLDVWINPTVENYQKLMKAFLKFGLSPFDMTEAKFLDITKNDVFTFGRTPVCIDILTKVSGLNFSETFSNAAHRNFSGIQVRIIDIRDLIKAKKAANRPKDQDDLEHLN
jgi:predicted nucleotidyltransferase